MGFGPEAQVSEREALLWGNIHHFYFPKLLVYLEAAKKTGVLTVTCNRVIKRIFLQNGVPTAARSNLKSELFGEFLIARRVISREEQEKTLLAQRGTKNSFGAVLLREEIITAQDLFAYARRQFLTILFSLFGLQKGGFRFDERSLPQNLYCYKVSFSNMLLFGIRQIPNSETLGRMIGDLSQSPVPTDRFMEYEKLNFTAEELSVIRRIDGVRSIEAIVESTGLERATTLRTLLVLFCHSLVKFPFRKDRKEEEEDVVDLTASARSSLGMTSYDSTDEKEEQAVAGNDFLVSPEGIHASDTTEPAQDQLPPTTEKMIMEEAIPPRPVNAPEEKAKKGMDGEASGEEEAVEAPETPENRSHTGLIYLFLTVLAVCIGIFFLSPGRVQFMDRLLRPSPIAAQQEQNSPPTRASRMAAWTRRLQNTPPSEYTIQVEVGENLALLAQDMNRLPSGLDAMLVPYQEGKRKAYALLVGVFENRSEGQVILQQLPPAIRADRPLIKTMATIQKGLTPSR
ncbi:MAG: DUF4388 domain-containing protein [Deltaproteobacteria bacterium]|nr:DUF4388 domain-containing protein [Deltaproteobacteria bacterium]